MGVQVGFISLLPAKQYYQLDQRKSISPTIQEVAGETVWLLTPQIGRMYTKRKQNNFQSVHFELVACPSRLQPQTGRSFNKLRMLYDFIYEAKTVRHYI